MKRLNVFFIPTASSGIQYWRVQAFIEAAWRMGAANFQNPLWFKDVREMLPWQKHIGNGPEYDPLFTRSFIPMIESGCINADAVVFQYCSEEGSLDLFEAIRQKFPRLPILTEIDDNVLSVPAYNEAFVTYDPRSDVRRRVISQIKQSDGVIVSTPYLKEIYAEYNKNIWVVPNSIDVKKWDGLRRKARPGIRIGWAGGSGHEDDFSEIQDAIKHVCKSHPEVKFIFINGPGKSGLPEYFRGVPQIQHKALWEPVLKYPQMLANEDFDIGIAPLVDSAFNRGKSNLKWLENSALGIPTVVPWFGHYAETCNPGVDCLRYQSPLDFEMALNRLIEDRKVRTKIGAAAKDRIRKDFNIDKTIFHYVDCLKEVIAAKKIGEPMGVA